MSKVFVHGNPETDAIWRPLTEALAARGVDDVVLLSPPGFGAPAPAGWEPTRAAYVAWLSQELERLPDEVDIVGHDWGAGHVFGLLAAHPEQLRSWAADCAGLLDPACVWHDAAQIWQQEGAGEAWVEAVAGVSGADRAAIYRDLGVAPDAASSMADAFDAGMGRCILGLYRDAVQPAMADLGAQVEAAPRPPGLVIDPTDDPYIPSALSVAVAQRLGARLHTLPGRGHWWMCADVDATADALVDFWRSA